MRAVKASISRALQPESKLKVVDNSGARKAKLISVIGIKSSQDRRQEAGVADVVKVVVKKGKPEVRGQEFPAIIVRQRKKYRRADGTRIHFEDNGCILLSDLELMTPKGTEIKGPVAKEVIQRFPSIGKIAPIIS